VIWMDTDGLGGLGMMWSKIVRLNQWDGCNSIYCICGRCVRESGALRENHLPMRRVT